MRFAIQILLVAVLLAPGPQAPDALLAGTWQRDDSRGDRNYWIGEYPDMTLEIRVEDDTVHVRQALGSVRDGVALPGSGERFHDYTLTADGERREVVTPNASRRESTARWRDGALEVVSSLRLGGGDGGQPVVIEMQESWRVRDGGATLELRRVAMMPERQPRAATIIFNRVR